MQIENAKLKKMEKLYKKVDFLSTVLLGGSGLGLGM